MTVNETLLSLVQRSGQLYFSFDLNTRNFVYINPAFKSFFHLESDTADYVALLALVHPDDKEYLIAKYSAFIASDTAGEIEFRIAGRYNQQWLRITFFLLEDASEKPMIAGYGEDITVYKEHSSTLNKHNNKKNTILNILAHDLAGPLGNINNLGMLLKREVMPSGNANADKFITMIDRISKNCIHLIHDFLNQEFLESSAVNLLKRRVDLAEKIQAAMDEYYKAPEGVKPQFIFTTNIEKVYAEIDEDKFLQVINNLISNALKFTGDGGTITVDLKEDEQTILLKIADTGIGIPKKYHATLFEKFSQARRPGLHGEQSTGLGMSIIKTIVEWHGFNIWFESEENKGTTFFINMPKTV